MRILGLDFGSKTVGVAVSDELMLTAQGLEIVRRQSPNKLRQTLARIEQIVTEYQVERIVLGLPKNMDGTEGPRAEKSRMVAQRLTDATGREVVLWDERRSSIEAHGILHANGRKEKKHRQTVDAVAASLILEGYLGTLR